MLVGIACLPGEAFLDLPPLGKSTAIGTRALNNSADAC